MSPAMMMNPGFFVRPLSDPAVASQYAMVSSSLVFEELSDALGHLEVLTARLDAVELAVPVTARPVRTHVPGAATLSGLVGYRLASSDPGQAAAVARQVTSLNAAARQLGMTGAETLESLAN